MTRLDSPVSNDRQSYDGKVYIGTILLEPNRWKPPRRPSYAVSEWFGRFEQSGFDGIELWEYHATLCPPEELAKLERSPLPIAVFNSYASFDDAGEPDRAQAALQVKRLRAGGVKFNLGSRWDEREMYLRHLIAWARQLPAGARVLCECHPGTIMEVPRQAAEVFGRLEELIATGTPRSPDGARAYGTVGAPKTAGEDDASRAPGSSETSELSFEVIVHPFYTEATVLAEFFRLLGTRITHAHVQMRDGDRFVCLDENPDLAKERLRLLRDEGFRGSFTLEFTAGTNTPGESREALYAAAERDLAFLREHWR